MSAGALWVLLALASALSGQGAETIPGTKLEPAELVSALPWSFEVAIEASGEPEGDQEPVKVTHYRFRSSEPYSSTAARKVYLRLQLTTSEHGDAAGAEAAFEELLASANPDTGLSYAWDHVLLSGTVVYHLHAPCLFSEENFRRLASRLEAAVLRPGQATSQRAATCRCGGGCREVAAELAAQLP